MHTKRAFGVSENAAVERLRALPVIGLVLAVITMMLVPVTAAHAAAGDLAFGVVHVDTDKNGALDATGPVGAADAPLAGVTVTLSDSSSPTPQTWTTVTAADGSWSFSQDDVEDAVGPFTVSIDVAGVNGDAYATQETRSPDNAFARSGGSQFAVSLPFSLDDAGVDGLELGALVYPSWSLNLAVASDAAGLGGKAIYTGTGPFDPDDSEPGFDSGTDNDRVRSADIVAYNWSLTAASDDAVGSQFQNAVLEQTIDLGPGAVVNFAGIPARCESGEIRAYGGPGNPPTGTVIQPLADPPAGTTRVVLTCVVGPMGDEPASSALVLPTSVQPSAASQNGSTFTSSARAYGVTPAGTPVARPAPGVDTPPIQITSAPRWDVDKSMPGSTNYLGFYDEDGNPSTPSIQGIFTYYTIKIATDRKVGIEAPQQPITLEESFWAATPGTLAPIPDLKWYIDQCIPTPAPRSGQVAPGLVYGKIGAPGSVATADNSVRDSGTCSPARTGVADTGNYTLTLSGIDTSGASYPTVDLNGSSLEAGPFYVASYRIRVFIPLSEIDRQEGAPDDGVGEIALFNRVAGFDPDGTSGASNFGSGFEPGYCQAGHENVDGKAHCTLDSGTVEQPASNNVTGPLTLRISPGSWAKYMLDWRASWANNYVALPGSGTTHDGAGTVQPGQTFTSAQFLENRGLDMTSAQMCDVFDNTTLKLVPLDNEVHTGDPWGADRYSAHILLRNGVALNAAGQQAHNGVGVPADTSSWVVKYGHIDLGADNANNGVWDAATVRYEGDWTNQRAATNGSGTLCGSPDITWYDSPTDAGLGGIDNVNIVWTYTREGYIVQAGDQERWLLAFEQRNTYNGGPNDGQMIRAGTVAANFGAVKTTTYNPNWSVASYIPGAGTTKPLPAGATRWAGENGSTQGDRWTVTRAEMRLQKNTVAVNVDGTMSTGASAVGVTGAGVAGRPIVWQITTTLTAASNEPAPVENVVVTDTLPKFTIYDHAATVALPGNIAPASYTENADGTTTVVWNLGQRVPNQPMPVLRLVTQTDPLTPNNTNLVNRAVITADGVAVVAAHTDDHTVRLEQTGEVQVKKSVDRTLDLQDQDQRYTLQMKNFSTSMAIQAPTIIEVLPYNGDASNSAGVNRSPASNFAGTNVLSAAPQVFDFDGTTPRSGAFLYTTVAPNLVPQHLSDDTDPSIWHPLDEVDLADVTAFKFVAADGLTSTVTSSTRSGLVITFQTDQGDNDPGDLYSNRFTAFSSTFVNDGRYQLLTSNLTTVRVIGFSLGDLIWFDVDGDGAYTAGVDRPVPAGVKVEVWAPNPSGDAEDPDVKVAETVTNDDGRWIVNDLPRGSYYAVVPASEFAAGGPLAGAVPALDPEADPNTDQNETADHHTVAGTGGAYRSSGLIVLDADTDVDPIRGLEPLGDNVAGLVPSPLTTDDFTNLTLDLAFVPPTEFTVTKVVDGDGAEYGTGPFTVEVSCEFDGSGVAGYPRTLVFSDAAGWTHTLSAPLGSECTADETGTGGATSFVIDPEDGVVLDDEESEFEITITNTFELGSLQVTKEASGVGADLAERTFTFSVVCEFNGRANAYSTTTSVTIDGGGSETSDVIDDIPVGAICVVTETSAAGADETPAPVTVTIDDDPETVQTAGFLNEFSAGTVEIVKQLDGDAAEDPFLSELEFTVQLVCQIDRGGDEPITLFDGPVSLFAGVPALVEDANGDDLLLPLGTHCWLSDETVDQGATSVEFSHSDWESAAVVTAGDPDELQTLELSATNTFDQAQLTVSKQVVGPGSGPFTFELICEYRVHVGVDDEGEEGDETAEPSDGFERVAYPLPEGDARFTLNAGESRTITVLAGVDCQVVEVDVPTGATVTIVDTDASTEGGAADGALTDLRGTENGAAFTNTFPPPLTETGANLSVVGLWAGAGALLLVGVALIAMRRARREGAVARHRR